ncbi:MAG: SPASM domain-containing protein [Candidatus Heimdallarchaeaceae archaeon]
MKSPIELVSFSGESGVLYFNYPLKSFRSPNYNWNFNMTNGRFVRWGYDEENDPAVSTFGPEILDLEVSTICSGINGKPCAHCYKSNTPSGQNMSFETFKKIFHKMPLNLTQIAFGIGNIDSNPDLFRMMEYCRNNEYNMVIPNITINGDRMTDKYFEGLANICGAIAVSRYPNNKELCYDAISKLKSFGAKQLNIHCLVSEETYNTCLDVIYEYLSDDRLVGLNAIVFLLLKPKGRRNKLTSISFEKFKNLVDLAFMKKVPIGFDSCSAPLFLKSICGRSDFRNQSVYVEACESSRMSAYINVNGRYFHCSFVEGEEGWDGVNVLNCDNFLKDVWLHPEVVSFRNLILEQKPELSEDCYECPIFNLYGGGIQ